MDFEQSEARRFLEEFKAYSDASVEVVRQINKFLSRWRSLWY